MVAFTEWRSKENLLVFYHSSSPALDWPWPATWAAFRVSKHGRTTWERSSTSFIQPFNSSCRLFHCIFSEAGPHSCGDPSGLQRETSNQEASADKGQHKIQCKLLFASYHRQALDDAMRSEYKLKQYFRFLLKCCSLSCTRLIRSKIRIWNATSQWSCLQKRGRIQGSTATLISSLKYSWPVHFLMQHQWMCIPVVWRFGSPLNFANEKRPVNRLAQDSGDWWIVVYSVKLRLVGDGLRKGLGENRKRMQQQEKKWQWEWPTAAISFHSVSPRIALPRIVSHCIINN